MNQIEPEQAHAVLSPSGSPTWFYCGGSVKAQYGLPPEKESVYAKEGTKAHKVGATCFVTSVDAPELIETGIEGDELSDEIDMGRYVQEYLDYVRAYAPDNELLVEQRIEYPHLVPGGFGTLDAAWFDPTTGIFHVFDAKFGRGIRVDALNNTQLLLYALGLYKEYGFIYNIHSFKLHSVQPRINNFSSWQISVTDLFAFGEEATKRAKLSMTDDAPRVPGVLQCQWCRAKGTCDALAKLVETTVKVDFDSLVSFTAPDIRTLSDERKKIILDNVSLMKSFFTALELKVLSNITDGDGLKGYKAVIGRRIRKWTEDGQKKLVDELGENAYNKKLIGVTQAQLNLGKKAVDSMTEKTDGKLILVNDADKRPAHNYSPFK